MSYSRRSRTTEIKKKYHANRGLWGTEMNKNCRRLRGSQLILKNEYQWSCILELIPDVTDDPETRKETTIAAGVSPEKSIFENSTEKEVIPHTDVTASDADAENEEESALI